MNKMKAILLAALLFAVALSVVFILVAGQACNRSVTIINTGVIAQFVLP